jgi:hypothetical protein
VRKKGEKKGDEWGDLRRRNDKSKVTDLNFFYMNAMVTPVGKRGSIIGFE